MSPCGIFNIMSYNHIVSAFKTLCNMRLKGALSSHHWPSLGTGAAVGALAGCWVSWVHRWAPSCPA